MPELEQHIADFVCQQVAEADTETRYRQPLVGFADAADPRFADLQRVVWPGHKLPGDILPGARSVVAFFLPFDAEVVRANATDRSAVAREWAVAYVETNDLIDAIAQRLAEELGRRGAMARAEKATHNWDPATFVSWWSHKSVAAIAGLGSFGWHHMLITDSGCAGRCGSLVVDAVLEPTATPGSPVVERCLHYQGGECLECVARCPVGALSGEGLDKHLCHQRCLKVAKSFGDLGLVEVCGKCATARCALRPGV
jgi:epoxyqueuosine reductase